MRNSPLRCKRASKYRVSTRRAATVVEFAITAPILFLIIFATVEFARLSMIRHTADNAAYEAARYVMVPGATAEEAKQVAKNMLAVVGVPTSHVQVPPDPIGESTASVTVTVDVPMDGHAWFLPTVSKSVNVRSSATLLTERVPAILEHAVPASSPSP